MKSPLHTPITKAVIPAAGRGTRLLPATKTQPKEMLPVGRKPTIQHVLEELFSVGLQDVLIVTGWHKRPIEDHLDFSLGGDRLEAEQDDRANLFHNGQLNHHLFYVRQAQQAGLADAVFYGRQFVGTEPFVVALGDTIIASRHDPPLLQRLIETHLATGAAATIAVEPVAREDIRKYGIVAPRGETGPAFEIQDIVEKPRPTEAPSHFAVASRYVFQPVIFEMISRVQPGIGKELQLTDAIRLLLQEGWPVWSVCLMPGETRYDIGNFESYFRAFFDTALDDPELGKKMEQYLRSRLERRRGEKKP